jgi:feruloyl-CoA synthase
MPVADLIRHPKVVQHIRDGLAAHNKTRPGSSTRIQRALLMVEPPSMENHEITEKGYVNQRAALERRADLEAKLFEKTPGPDVIDLG